MRAKLLEKNLSPAQVAIELGVTYQTLWRWRQAGYGPAWFRLGPRLVRYKFSDVKEWEDRLRNEQ